MVRDQVFARLREEALFSRTCSVFQLFFAGRKAEVCRRAAHIVDVSLKIRFLCQVFRLIDDRFVASYLNNTPLMERQRTEAAAAEAATVADQAEFHLRERRDPACRIVGRMPPPHIRKCVDIIHLLNRKRFCRWVLDNIKVVPVLLHKTFSRKGIRIFILDIEAFRMDHYKRVGIEAEKVEKGVDYGIYHTTFKIKDDPLVSVIIPNKDHTVDLDNCIRPMLTEGTYKNLEFVIVENNSTEQATWDYYEKIQKEFPNVHVIRWEREFNYSAINNFGVQHAKGEYLLFMNNDIELIAKNFVEEMLGFVQREDVGIAGARLLYEDDTIQHAGVVIGFGGIAGHTFIGLHKSENSYFNRAMCAQDYSAVTAACMMSKRSVFDAVGGFTEELAVAFNDIDYCMKVRKLGKLVVYAPYAVLHHYESKSRGLEDTPEKVERFNREIATFAKRWPEILRDGDPYYNPNLTLRKSNFALRDLKKEKIGEPYKLEVPLDE